MAKFLVQKQASLHRIFHRVFHMLKKFTWFSHGFHRVAPSSVKLGHSVLFVGYVNVVNKSFVGCW